MAIPFYLLAIHYLFFTIVSSRTAELPMQILHGIPACCPYSLAAGRIISTAVFQSYFR